jgi:cell division protein DivIC
MIKNAIWLFALALLTFVVFLPSFTKMQDIKAKNVAYEAELEELKAEHARLLEEKRRLEEDPVYLEKVAREKMGIVKEGEVVYRLKPVKSER